jgi:hypothetical protein
MELFVIYQSVFSLGNVSFHLEKPVYGCKAIIRVIKAVNISLFSLGKMKI